MENILIPFLKNVFETDASTDEGMKKVAKDYGVYKEWRDYLKESKEDDRATKYYKLLLLVKIMSQDDNIWIIFVEGLHRHAAIVMCLTCSDFDLHNNYIEQGSLKKRTFKLAGVPHYKKPDMTPIQVLNEILNNRYNAPMLMKPFLVQVLIPKHKASQIDKMMTTLKETSKWISTNKRNSAEKPMSKRLSEELATIMEFSTPKDRLTFQPKLEVHFKYQLTLMLISLTSNMRKVRTSS
jgi:hypothetical protein